MIPDKKDKPLRTGEAAVPVLDRAVYKRLSRKLYSSARRGAQGSLEGSPQRQGAGSPQQHGAGSSQGQMEVSLKGTGIVSIPVTYGEAAGRRAVCAAAGELLAAGYVPSQFCPVILLPPGSAESQLRRITDEIASACSEEGLVIGSTSDIRVEVSPAVTGPVIIGTASGEPRRVQLREQAPDMRADQADAGTAASEKAVVMSGMAAAEAAFLISRSREEDLLKRFPVSMVLRCAQMENLFSVRRAAEIARECGSGGGVMVSAGAGGVYAALWKLREKCMTGFSVQIRQIPVLQEAIEIAEYYGFDVYAAASAGCLLMTTDDAEQLLLRLRGEGIPAAVIGRTKGPVPETLKPGGKGADKPRRPGAAELVNGDEVRYLDYPPADAVLGFI